MASFYSKERAIMLSLLPILQRLLLLNEGQRGWVHCPQQQGTVVSGQKWDSDGVVQVIQMQMSPELPAYVNQLYTKLLNPSCSHNSARHYRTSQSFLGDSYQTIHSPPTLTLSLHL